MRNGRNRYGKQHYLCKDCQTCRVLTPKEPPYSPERKEEILHIYQELSSYAGSGTVNRCIASNLVVMNKKVCLSPSIEETLLPVEPEDVSELDEVWSFVYRFSNKRWLWTAQCRRTRQIVAALSATEAPKLVGSYWS